MTRKAMISTVVFVLLAALVAPSSVGAVDVPPSDPDKALVVFYRGKKFKGGAIRFDVNHSGGSLGRLGSGTYLFGYFEPGKRQFWSQVIAQDSITLNLEAGKTYFVRGEVKMGVYAGRPSFRQVDEPVARADLSKL
jgi:hypothetical protein